MKSNRLLPIFSLLFPNFRIQSNPGGNNLRFINLEKKVRIFNLAAE